MAKRVLLKDVAESAGVSTALVSYVLNNKDKEARVSPSTAKKIRKVAREMHYRPNQIAKSLKSGRSLAIGAILADISNPFFAQLARTIENVSENRGYAVIFGSSDEKSETSQKLIDAMVSRQIDGFIIAPAEGSESQLKYLKDLNIPFVLIDRYYEEIETNYVIIDNFQATYNATQHLISQGYEQIAFVKYDNNMMHTTERYRGYTEAMHDNGLGSRLKELTCEVDIRDYEQYKLDLEKLLQGHPKPDSIVFSTNDLSVKGIKMLIGMGIKIPEDVGIFCFDESESYDLFYSPISYVCQPLEEIGKEAVEILIRKLTERGNSDYIKEILDTKLILGESSRKIKKRA